MSEKLNQRPATPESTIDSVEFAQYQNASEAFEHYLYGSNMAPAEVTVEKGKIYGDQNLVNFPERAINYYGYDAAKQAVIDKRSDEASQTSSAKYQAVLVPPAENVNLINQLRDSWFNALVDAAANDEDDNRINYYSALNNTLDELPASVIHPSSPNLTPSLESSIEHAIAHLTEVCLDRAHAGRLDDAHRTDYARRVSLLNNIHAMAQQITSEENERTSA